MATVYSPLTAPQVDGFVSGTISSSALSDLNAALAKADGGDSTKAIFDLTLHSASDDISGGSVPQTVISATADTAVFYAGSDDNTNLQLAGPGSEIVVGGSGALFVVGSNAPQTMIGGTGAVSFDTGSEGGNHLLEAGSAAGDGASPGSVLFGGTGLDTLVGSSAATGAAELVGGTGFNTLIGGLGNDTLVGGGHSVLNAGADGQLLFSNTTTGPGQVSFDTLNAGSFNNELLQATFGNNVLNAGSGTGDLLFGGTGADTLNGGTSNATLVGGTGKNILLGGTGANTLVGGGQSLVEGGSGNQLLTGGYSATASDTLDAGSGTQILGVSQGNNILNGGSGASTLFAGSGSDTLTAGSGPSVLVGGSGTSHLFGGSGNDTLFGGGQSSLTGGSGTDLLVGGFSSSAHDTLVAGTGLHQTLGVSQGNNFLFANADTANSGISDTLFGGSSGNDVLTGSASTSGITFYGVGYGSANTTVTGGAGTDDVFVHAGTGKTSIDGGGGSNFVTFSDHAFKGSHISTDKATGVTTVTFNGSAQTTTIKNVTSITFDHGHTVTLT